MPHWLMIAFISIPSAALAQERQPDALYFTGEGTSAPSASGKGVAAEWLHWTSSRTGVTLSGASTSVGNLWWTYGTVGAQTRRTHVIWMGRMSLGSGRGSERGFAYARYAGSVTVPIVRGFYAESEGQHVRLADTATTVFKIGGLYAGSRGVTLQMAYYVGLSRAVQAQSLSARGGFSAGRFGAFGGVTGTTQNSPPLDLPAIDLWTYHSRESFVGASLMTGRSQLIGAVQVVPQPVGRLYRMVATWRLPLGRPETLTPEALP
jgi:hypothetical protein